MHSHTNMKNAIHTRGVKDHVLTRLFCPACPGGERLPPRHIARFQGTGLYS
jgi:hypothetical protein